MYHETSSKKTGIRVVPETIGILRTYTSWLTRQEDSLMIRKQEIDTANLFWRPDWKQHDVILRSRRRNSMNAAGLTISLA
jgi:hypothetical protein